MFSRKVVFFNFLTKTSIIYSIDEIKAVFALCQRQVEYGESRKLTPLLRSDAQAGNALLGTPDTILSAMSPGRESKPIRILAFYHALRSACILIISAISGII